MGNTITGSGQVSLGDIYDEFTDTHSGAEEIQLTDYYEKGNAPASGEIQLAADFYGTSAGIATGGIISIDGSDTVHIFESNGNFVLTETTSCDILIVGGGGGGGSMGGGGGGGGAVCYRNHPTLSGAGDYGTSYSIVIGVGGASNENGGTTLAFSVYATGGGAGGQGWNEDGSDGANGGGASWTYESGYVGGTGTAPSNWQLNNYWTVSAGNDGYSYNWTSQPPALGGGGGGSSATATSKTGGNGVSYDITGTSYNWGAGGGGCGYNTTAGSGGTGGGGGGAGYNTTNGSAGSGGYNAGSGGTDTVGGAAGTNTGSGGGGGRWDYAGGAGGDGIVVIRYAI